MKKYFILLLVTAAMLSQACQDNDLLYDFDNSPGNSQTIEFGNYVSGITRASRIPGNSFVNGDKMQVYGFQTVDGATSQIFKDQLVSTADGITWSYTPKKYWNNGSVYDFYAIFPYDVANNSFDNTDRKFSVNDFTVADVTANQVDIMIAKQITNRVAQNMVNFEFNHILSNVNFYVKTATSFDTGGITSVKVLEFDVTGLYSTGDFVQSGWNGNNMFEGAWTADNTSSYNMPMVTNVTYTINDPSEPLIEDLLLLPQTINDNAQIYVKYMLNYSDGTQAVFKRTADLNKIVGAKKSTPGTKVTLDKWDPNYRYNYTIAVDPSKNENAGDTIPTDPTDPNYPATPFIDYDGGVGGYQTPDAYLVEDANGDYWIDTDNDGTGDIKILWEDIDGDGKLEGVADKDGDGILTVNDSYDNDNVDYNGNPNAYDVIMVDKDGDGTAETELEKPEPTVPEVPLYDNTIEFSAVVIDWSDDYDAEHVLY